MFNIEQNIQSQINSILITDKIISEHKILN